MLDRMREETSLPASIGADGRQTLARLDDLVTSAHWDSFDLILRIAAWAECQGHATALTEHLECLSAGETG